MIPISFAEISEPLVGAAASRRGVLGPQRNLLGVSAELEGEAGDAGQLATPFGLERVERLICAIRQHADVGCSVIKKGGCNDL